MRVTRSLLTALVLALAAFALPAAPADADDLPVPYHFLPHAVIAGAHPYADPPGANHWRCRPSSRHPRPVVLVHGTFANKNDNWQTYAPLLKNHGYCVFALNYGVPSNATFGQDQVGGMNRIEDSAVELKRFVRRVLRATGARKVDLIGHSQGTLMPNYYVKFLGGARHVRNYVSLAPLWHGTMASPFGGFRAWAAMLGVDTDAVLYCNACGQMARGSRFMAKMRRGGVAVRGVRYLNLMTRYDELVLPYTSGIEAGMTNVVLQDRCAKDASEHGQIAADPVAAAIVLNRLDPRHRRPVPCVPVLPGLGTLSP